MFTLKNACAFDDKGKLIDTKSLTASRRKLVTLECIYGWWISLPAKTKVPILIDNMVTYIPIEDVQEKARIVIEGYPQVMDYEVLDWAYARMSRAYLKTSGRSYTVRVSCSAHQAMKLFTVLLSEGVFAPMSVSGNNVKMDIRSREIQTIARRPDLYGIMPRITELEAMRSRRFSVLRYTPSAYNSEYRKIIYDIVIAHQIRKRPQKYSDEYWKFMRIASLYKAARTGGYISKFNKRLLRQPRRLFNFLGHEALTKIGQSQQATMLEELMYQQERVFCLQVKRKEVAMRQAVDIGTPSLVNGIKVGDHSNYQLLKLSHVTYI